MKIGTVLVGVKLQPDQPPKTPVIHKVGGYGSGSHISRGLVQRSPVPGTEDTPDQRASLRSFAGSGKNRKYCIGILAPKVPGEGLVRSPGGWNFYCAAPFLSTSAISQRALLSFISSSMPLIALLLGIRLPSGRRRVELLFSAVLMLVDWLVGCSEPQQRGEALGAAGVFSTFGFGRKVCWAYFLRRKRSAS